jgi:TolB protein
MWFTNDAFHFVWKKVSGDLSLAADVIFEGTGGNAHRKACLMFRQSLDADSAYVDAALHGDGLTSLQYREVQKGMTREVQCSVAAPKRLQLQKRGKNVSLFVGSKGAGLTTSGASIRVDLADPYYVGFAVCAHDNDRLERAVFSNVQIEELKPIVGKPKLISTLETVAISSKDRRVVYWSTNLIEAPNWGPGTNSLLFNSQGRIYRLPVNGGNPQAIDTGFATRCNNDHGISPDGTRLVISDQSQERRSLIYVVPIGGGTPERLTPLGPSYWHGWSPDGKTLAYCAERNGEFDIYTVPAHGGPEKRLTSAKGLDDGPDYSADGKFIYFNSDRNGTMQVWRMSSDGDQQEQITKDEFNNWFSHPSPDGKWLLMLSYEKEVTGHPENKDVALRIMPLNGGKIEVLAKLFGGQGTVNVPSWSADSRKVAFVSYQLLP